MIHLGKPYIKTDVVLEEVKAALDTKWISGGPTIKKFEDAVKKYNNDPDGRYIAVSNGTTAIEMALLYLNDGQFYTKEDEIITTSWSWVATGFSVPRVGATPVWCDVNQYGVPTAAAIRPLITDKTKAIIVVHQMGIPCDMDEINKLERAFGIPIIEDAACAIGSEYKGDRIGKSKNIVTYSFQARKVLTTGEGGMIVVRTDHAEKWLRSYRAFGTNSLPLDREKSTGINKEFFDKLGGNYKLSDIASAVGIAHLKYVDEEIELRTKAAEFYNDAIRLMNLEGYNVHLGNIVPEYCTRYNWQNYHIILGNEYIRDVIVEIMKAKGIGCKWDIQAIHLEPILNYRNERLQNTEMFHSHGMWLPFYAEITREEQEIVIKTLKETLIEFNGQTI